jgi:hypothetical protein
MFTLTMFGIHLHKRPQADPGSPQGGSENAVEGHPAVAPPGSLWAQQDDVDFFVNPALALDTLDYITPNGAGPEGAFREAFDLPPRSGNGVGESSADEEHDDGLNTERTEV